MQYALEQQPRNFIRSVFVLASSVVASQILFAAATPLLTRLYTPSDFGLWTLLLSGTALTSVVVCLRYELAIVLPRRDEDGATLYGVCIFVAALMSLATSIIAALWGSSILSYLDAPELEQWLWVFPLLVLVAGVFRANSFWTVRKERFSWLACYRPTVALITVGVQIVFGLLWSGSANGLIWGTIFGLSTGAVLLVSLNWRANSETLRQGFQPMRMLQLARLHSRYPRFSAPYSFIVECRKQSFIVLLGIFANPAEIGLYVLAQKICYLPVSLISSSFNPVYFQRAAEAEPLSDLGELVVRMLRGLLFLAVPFTALVCVAAPMLFGWIFGAEWSRAGLYAIPIVGAATMLVLTGWLDRTFDVLGRQRLALHLEIARTTISITILVVGFVLFDPLSAVAMSYVAFAIFEGIWLLIVFRLAKFPVDELVRLARDGVLVLILAFAFLQTMIWAFGAVLGIVCYLVASTAYAAIILNGLRTDFREAET